MTLRTLIFWPHLIAGVVAGAVVLTMSVTGVLLTYERQLNAWSDSEFKSSPPAEGAARLSVEDIVTTVRRDHPDVEVGAVTFNSRADAPVSIAAGRQTIYADAYTGRVLGEGNQGMRAFMSEVRAWHRWLSVEGEGSALCPRHHRLVERAVPVHRLLRASTCGSHASGRGSAFGRLCCSAAAFVARLVTSTGTTSSASGPVCRSSSSSSRRCPSRSHGRTRSSIALWAKSPRSRVDGVDAKAAGANAPSRVLRRSNRQSPVSTHSGPLPRSRSLAGEPSMFESPLRIALPWCSPSIKATAGSRSIDRRLTLNRATGEVVSFEAFSDQSLGRRLRSISRFAHTGEVLGLPGQTIAGLATAGAVVLVWTGIALTLRRFRAWVTRRSKRQIEVVAARDASAA